MSKLPAERWHELERVVDAALDAEPADRARVVAVECGGDEALREAALAWLRGCDRADGVLDAPALVSAAQLAELAGMTDAGEELPPLRTADLTAADGSGGRAAGLPPVGSLVGVWRLERELGRGGMGVVFLARRDDAELPMRVALKIMQRAAALDPVGVRRFREERRILATLSHPGIARLVDGGITAAELPWFAMEYVDGAPIDRWCDQRALTVEERLRLFCAVCEAVHHAHRQLVVHRDLKPSNVLVSESGQPKLLDFGIAKLLDLSEGDGDEGSADRITRTGMRPMTPAFASPEQVRGEPISTASDIYSLGVLLYVLLSGHLPYAAPSETSGELERRIVTGDAERPSAAVGRTRAAAHHVADATLPTRVAQARRTTPTRLRRRLRGDLDLIVARAMHAEPERRYPTADALAADVRRHLEGLPVEARPDTPAYRLRKLLARRPVEMAATGVVVAVLLAFTGLTLAQSARVAAERDRAEQVTTFLSGLLASTDPYDSTGAPPTVRALLDRGAAQADTGLRHSPEVRARLLAAMAPAYFGLGEWERARVLMEEVVALQRWTLGADDPALAASLAYLAQVRMTEGAPAAAESLYHQALAIRRARPAAPGGPDSARLLSGLGAALQKQGRSAEAEALLRPLLLLERGREPEDPRAVAQVARNLAHALRDRGDHAGAEPFYREAYLLHRAAFGNEHPETANSAVNLAMARFRLGDAAGAEPLYRRAIATKRLLLGASHPDVAGDEVGLAELLASRGALAEAESLLVAAVHTHRATLPADHAQLAHDLERLGDVRLRRGDRAGARAALEEAVAIRRRTLPAGHRTLVAAEGALRALR